MPRLGVLHITRFTCHRGDDDISGLTGVASDPDASGLGPRAEI